MTRTPMLAALCLHRDVAARSIARTYVFRWRPRARANLILRCCSLPARERRITLNVFRTSGLPFRRRHHETVEVVAHLDLA